ncbi:MAG: S1-like domain-containing RNA-binding protein [Bacteroidales bacterium]|nr:S1-like domain-containing RNA-binding protein [Bacteroidales bacterium]
MNIELGKMNHLRVVKHVDFGVYLDGGEEAGEILLPSRYVPENCQPDDELDVFLYLDQEERLIATTLTPKAQVGDFAYLKVAWVNQFGAFLDWGLMKDLFVPFREQKMRMQQDKSYIVYVHIDEDSYRIVASAKIDRYLQTPAPDTYQNNDEVDLLIVQKTDLGFKAIVDNQYMGLIYDSEVFRPLHTGDKVKGYIKQVREDGKIDLVLQTGNSAEQVADFSEQLLNYLKENNGHSDLNDKSDAQLIYQTFGVSKKIFKKGVGDLYKRHLITLENGLTLTHKA